MANKPNPTSWKTQSYALGAVAGLFLGLLGAYFYVRAAEDYVDTTGNYPRAQTGEMIGLGLAGLAMVRQIAEMGKPDLKKRGR
jgi:H+/Cl- antiporter ClcA